MINLILTLKGGVTKTIVEETIIKPDGSKVTTTRETTTTAGSDGGKFKVSTKHNLGIGHVLYGIDGECSRSVQNITLTLAMCYMVLTGKVQGQYKT